MKKILIALAILIGATLAAHPFEAAAGAIPVERMISGQIVNGYRVLPVENNGQPVQLHVYRGDYIKFKVAPSVKGLSLVIPALSIDRTLSRDMSRAPYFKMKQAGTFAFTLGDISGHIIVAAYRQERYTEVSAADAARIIETRDPLILDVRTPGEYRRGHLENAVLIPVQVLQQNLDRLGAHKDRDILVYCATGNRSTVASKLLIDAGFKRILNLRRGIAEWYKLNYPVVQ